MSLIVLLTELLVSTIFAWYIPTSPFIQLNDFYTCIHVIIHVYSIYMYTCKYIQVYIHHVYVGIIHVCTLCEQVLHI